MDLGRGLGIIYFIIHIKIWGPDDPIDGTVVRKQVGRLPLAALIQRLPGIDRSRNGQNSVDIELIFRAAGTYSPGPKYGRRNY